MPNARRLIAALAFAALAGTAAAEQEPLLDGVYSNEPGCASGHDPTSGDISYLHDWGVEEYEGGCLFLEKIPDETHDREAAHFVGFVAIGYCQEPGFTTPHVFHVRRHAELPDGRFTVMLVFQDGAETNETEYHPCAGSALQP